MGPASFALSPRSITSVKRLVMSKYEVTFSNVERTVSAINGLSPMGRLKSNRQSPPLRKCNPAKRRQPQLNDKRQESQ